MNRRAYRAARRLLRDNGRYALRWMSDDERRTMRALLAIQDSTDRLAERAEWCAIYRREGVTWSAGYLPLLPALAGAGLHPEDRAELAGCGREKAGERGTRAG